MNGFVLLRDRARLYNQAYPSYPPLTWTERWIYGVWMIGNNYRSKMGYYGEYPPSYLNRIMSMFPDADKKLHLFSGSVHSDTNTIDFDISPDVNPDIVGNAERLSEYFSHNCFDLILADPPYSAEDARHYNTVMINRNKVVKECSMVLEPGGFLVWLDQVLPMYRKKELELVGTIGLIRSTNHRFRVVSIFRKTDNEGEK